MKVMLSLCIEPGDFPGEVQQGWNGIPVQVGGTTAHVLTAEAGQVHIDITRGDTVLYVGEPPESPAMREELARLTRERDTAREERDRETLRANAAESRPRVIEGDDPRRAAHSANAEQ